MTYSSITHDANAGAAAEPVGFMSVAALLLILHLIRELVFAVPRVGKTHASRLVKG